MTPPKIEGGGAFNKKYISKDTTRAYHQTIYRWAAYCYEYESHELSDNSGAIQTQFRRNSGAIQPQFRL